MEQNSEFLKRAFRALLSGMLVFAVGTLLLLGLSGCDDDDDDRNPPAVPTGLYSVTADNLVILRWNPNRETDLAGYHILSNMDGGSEYEIIDTIDALDEDYYNTGYYLDDPGDDYLEYWDDWVDNGNYYWYAIIAFDDEGNESEMSYETIVDVPRPEGSIALTDMRASLTASGMDFSSLSEVPQRWDLLSTDIYLHSDDSGVLMLVAAHEGVLLQDYGYVDFDVATYAPEYGWSNLGMTEAILGHTYIFKIYGNEERVGDFNYAKLTIDDVDDNTIYTYWGYQSVDGEPELKRPQDDSASDIEEE